MNIFYQTFQLTLKMSHCLHDDFPSFNENASNVVTNVQYCAMDGKEMLNDEKNAVFYFYVS